MRRLSIDPRKWGYLEMFLILAVPGVLIFLFISVDYFGTPLQHVAGVILDERDTWTTKHGDRCQIDVGFKFTRGTTSYYGKCRHEWKSGDTVSLFIRTGRLTGAVIVETGSLRANHGREKESKLKMPTSREAKA